MDPISVENALAGAEFLRNENEETVFSGDESPDSGYSSEKIEHPLVIENKTNDKVKVNKVPRIELDHNIIDLTVSSTETGTEFTIESSKEPKSKETEQVCGFRKLIIFLFRIQVQLVVFKLLATK